MNLIQSIHEKALRLAGTFKKAEHDLLTVLEEVDSNRVFEKLGYSSLFTYVVGALKIPESYAYALINVSRKAKQIPELKLAIASGDLSVSQAKRITSVITPQNSAEWISKAQNLTQRQLEKEVVAVNPKKSIEKMTYVTTERMQFQCGISENLMKKIRRVQDLVSQRLKRGATLEEALEIIITDYLQRKDPVKKAERVKAKVLKQQSSRKVRPPMPATVKHQVVRRDRGQCSFVDPQGKRCAETRWVDIHHVKPVALGGTHEPENLATLCFHHHRLFHDQNRYIPIRIDQDSSFDYK